MSKNREFRIGEQAGNVRKRKGKFDRFEQFNECNI